MNCQSCNSLVPNTAKFCPECGSPLRPEQIGRTPSPPAAPRITVALSEERRTMTVLFSDLKGFSSLAEQKDSEEVHQLLSELFTRLTRVVEAHGGYVDKYIGDAIMALFGVPHSHEDDPVRAISCALDMHHELEKFNQQLKASGKTTTLDPLTPGPSPGGREEPDSQRISSEALTAPLQMRIGINTGEVTWGELAGGQKTVIGDAVNIAQRLEGLALPGRTIVGPQTKKLAEGKFTFRPLPVTAVKGRTQPVQPYEVGSRIQIDAHYRTVKGLHAPLVGRERELQFLKDVFEEVRRRSLLRMVIVAGEAGVGKSRLLYEFRNFTAELPETVREEHGSCIAYRGAPFWPLMEMFRRRYGIAGATDPEKTFLERISPELKQLERYNEIERENFAHILGIAILGLQYPAARVHSLDPKQFREALRVAFRAWTEAITIKHPAVLIIEDLHWADEGTLELLEDMLRLSHDIPLMIIVLMREEQCKALRLLEKTGLIYDDSPLFEKGKANRLPPFEKGGAGGDFSSDDSSCRRNEIPLNLPLEKTPERKILSPDEIARQRTVLLRLQTLPPETIIKLARELLGAEELSDELSRLITEQTGGNPYYTEELIRFLIEGGLLEREKSSDGFPAPTGRGGRDEGFRETEGEGDDRQNAGTTKRRPVELCRLKPLTPEALRVPDTLSGLLMARLDALGRDAGEVVSAASVIGRCFWRGMLAQILARTVDDELQQLSHRDIVFLRPESDIPEDLEYIFKHALLKEAAYGRLTRRARRQLHRLIAEWMETHEDKWAKGKLLALEATHWENAEEPARALKSWTKAAEITLNTSPAEAEGYLASALRLLPKEASREERMKLTEKRGEARITLGRLNDAREDFEVCLQLAATPEERARMRRSIARIEETRGNVSAAEQMYRDALSELGASETAEGGSPSLLLLSPQETLELSAVLNALAWLRGEIQGKIEEAKTLTTDALKIVSWFKKQHGSNLEGQSRSFDLLPGQSTTSSNKSQSCGVDPPELQVAEADSRSLIVRGWRLDIRGDWKSIEQEQKETAEKTLIACKRNLGVFALRQGKLDEAEVLFKEAIEFYQVRGDRRGVGKASGNIGLVYYFKGEFDRALECLKKDLAINEEIGDRRGVGMASSNIGLVYRAKGELDRALECYQKDLAISEEIGDRRGVGIASGNIGNVYYHKGELDRALECYQKYLAISEEIGDQRGVGIVSCSIGNVYATKGELDRALECYQKYLAISKEISDQSAVGGAFGNIGAVYQAKGELDRALEYYEKQLAISEEIGNRWGVGTASGNIGDVYYAKGELDRALECYQKYLAISEEIGYRRGVGIASGNIGNVYYARGELERALELQMNYLKISKEISYKEGMWVALCSIASIMVSRGEYDRGDEAAGEARKLAAEIGTKSAEASIVSLQATTKRRRGRYEEALATHRQALRMAEEAKASAQVRGEMMLELCHDAVMLKDEALARDYLRAAESLIRDTKKFLTSVELSVGRATVELKFGDRAVGVSEFKRLITLLHERGYHLRANELADTIHESL